MQVHRGMFRGFLLTLLGLLSLTLIGGREIVLLQQEPFKNAFILFDLPDAQSRDEAIPASLRLVQRSQFLESDLILQMMGELTAWDRFSNTVRLADPELVIAIDLPQEMLLPMLESGRLPEQGQPEVLAGDLAREDPFEIDGIEFRVVGRLKRTVSGFLFAYLLPFRKDFKPLFLPEWGGVEGYFFPDGSRLIERGLLPDYFRSNLPKDEGDFLYDDQGQVVFAETEDVTEVITPVLPNYLGGVIRSSDVVVFSTFFAMILVAVGCAYFHYYLFLWLNLSKNRLLGPLFEEIIKRPTLYRSLYIFYYAVFFYAVWFAIENPLLAWRVKQYIEAVFNHGGLGHVGAAYDSGNIFLAAWMTFYNNFIEQTLGLTFLVSLFPIPLGLLKNLLSFWVVGNAMAPLWSGSAVMLSLHSLTMALELQAYVLACFAITVWTLFFFSGIFNHLFLPKVKRGLGVFISAIVVTGFILGIAAFYEAFTLIHIL